MRQACEAIRHSLVYSMRAGDRLVIYFDKMTVDMKKDANFPPDHWPSEEIFNWPHWREFENYMKVVKEDENHDLL